VEAEIDGADARLSHAGNTVWLLPDAAAATFPVSLEQGWVSPSYGVKIPTIVLVWRATTKVPLEASYLFAESRLAPRERTAVSEALRQVSTS
jgi:hypothetical protein